MTKHYCHILVHRPNLNINSRWKQTGVTVAGGHGKGNAFNQLDHPFGLDIDDEGVLFITDWNNHRVMRWKCNERSGEVIVGGKGEGNGNDQLNRPVAMIIDRKTDSFIISERENRRVMRWSRQQNDTNGQVIISDILSYGLAIDDEGFLYVSDVEKDEVRRYEEGDVIGTVVAGGNGRGDRLNQLNRPRHIFVDCDHSVYVSDSGNHRVMKWMKNANEGIVVAGGQGDGDSVKQLCFPGGLFVDSMGSVYVVDQFNHRVMRWLRDATEGSVIVGGNGRGSQDNQFNQPTSISFDRQGNLYVVDCGNHRVERFSLEHSGCSVDCNKLMQ